ncbi:hypothetical protein EDB84DRAFT_1680454 [Lactarius hengduanensis]|nr:hypothetical protein EDB84DRAFT_1680454 [Lactarius hengduanensis]
MYQDSPRKPKLISGSVPFFSMYNERAKEHDGKKIERWKGDVEGFLLFSDPPAEPSTQMMSIPDSNVLSIPISNDTSTSLSTNTKWVCTLWSCGLVIGLNCAAVAMLLQWSLHEYEWITQEGDDPQKCALIQEFMRYGLQKPISFHWMLELLSTLLNLSLFMFLAGFVISLIPLDCFVAKMAGGNYKLVVIAILVLGNDYELLTTGTNYFVTHHQAHHTCLGNPMGFISLFLHLHYFVTSQLPVDPEEVYHIRKLAQNYYQQMSDMTIDMKKLVDEDACDLTSSTFLWTFESIDDDCGMDCFLTSIPGFYVWARAHFGGKIFQNFNSSTLASLIISFVDHIHSSNLLPDFKKHNHIKNCLKAINADPLLLQSTFRKTLQTLNSNIFTCTDFVHFSLEQLNRDDSDLDPW